MLKSYADPDRQHRDQDHREDQPLPHPLRASRRRRREARSLWCHNTIVGLPRPRTILDDGHGHENEQRERHEDD